MSKSENSENKTTIILKNVRTSFMNVFRRNTNGTYSCNFLIDPEDAQVAKLKSKMKAVATEKWGAEKAPKMLKKLKIDNRLCLKDGASKEEYDGYEGMLFVSASNQKKPGTFDNRREEVTEDDGILYSGCYVNAKITLWAQDHKEYGKRINATLEGLQYAGAGEAFGGGRVATSDDFDDLGDLGEDDLFDEDDADVADADEDDDAF